MKNFLKLLTILIIGLTARVAFASIEITEIMYDASGSDTNREWIEVYNNSSNNIDFSEWYFFSDNTKHALVPQTSPSIPGGGYAVIVQDTASFKADYPNFSGLIFDSSWSGLSNEGETIALKDPTQNIISEILYAFGQGGSGDGNSLQKIGSSFIGSFPTPGSLNELLSVDTKKVESQPNNNSSTSSTQNTPTSSSSKSSGESASTKKVEPKVIKVKILAKNNAVAKVAFPISANVTDYDGSVTDKGKFVWSFGDGNTRVEERHKPFEYAYQDSGDYVLTLTYYDSILRTVPQASDSINISVGKPELFISSVGSGSDPFVEIKNPSSDKQVLSFWTLNSANKIFKFPEGMAILPGKSVVLRKEATGFDASDMSYLTLVSPNGSLMSVYPNVKSTSYSGVKRAISYDTNTLIKDESQINAKDLSASVANIPNGKNYIPIITLIVLIGLGVLSIVLVYRKSHHVVDGIEKLAADDIKIIE